MTRASSEDSPVTAWSIAGARLSKRTSMLRAHKTIADAGEIGMRTFFSAVALALAATPVATPAAEPSGAVDIRPFVAREITPQVHLLTMPEDWYAAAIGNVILIEQSDGFVVVDSGINASNGRAVVRYAKSLASKPIKAVMITHWHGDHPQGVSAIRDAYPNVRIISTRGTEEGIRGPGAYDIGFRPDPTFDRAIANLAEKNKADYRKLLDDPKTAPDRKERIKKALVQFDEVTRDFTGSYLVLPTETFEHELVIKDRDVPVQMMFLGRANTDGTRSPGCRSRTSWRAAISSCRPIRSASEAIPATGSKRWARLRHSASKR